MKPIAILVAAFLGACSQAHKTQPSQALAPASTQDWKRYDGDGFSLRYPSNASLHPARSHPSNFPGTAIRGSIDAPPTENAGRLNGPSFELIVSVFPNPAGRTAEQWVDSVRRAWNRDLQPDSLEFLGPPDTVGVNGLPALRLRPFCGDCAPEEIYLTDAKHTAVLSYVIDDASVPRDRETQRNLYEAILNTFVWASRESSSLARPNTR